MNQAIDKMNSITGWLASSNQLDLSVNQFDALVYEGAGSLRVRVKPNSNTEYFEKQYSEPIDISAMNDFRFAIQRWSKQTKKYKKIKDFSLKIAIGNGSGAGFKIIDEWYVPVEVSREWMIVNIDVKHITSFQSIRFTIVDNKEETYFIDNLLAVKDEAIIDVLLYLQSELNNIYKINLGKLPTPARVGAGGITLPDWSNVTRHSNILISENNISEIHQINSAVSDDGKVVFAPSFDGATLINSYTPNADVYLTVPCQISNKNINYVEPGLVLSGFVGNPELISSHSVKLDSYKVSGTVGEIRDFSDISFPITILVTCSQPELMVLLNEFIQNKFCDDYQIPINGFKYDTIYEGNEFAEGNLEDDSDSTIHKMTVQMNAPFGIKRKYRQFPVSPNLNINFNQK